MAGNNEEETRGWYISRNAFTNNYSPNVRPDDTHLLCEIKWGKYGKPWLHWCRNQPEGLHAEQYFMESIFESKRPSVSCYVTWYLSWSPCANCSSEIVTFLEKHPYLKLTIYVARIYNHNIEENRQGLRLLRAKKVIIRVMDIADYNYCWEVFVNRQNGNEDFWPWHFDQQIRENYLHLSDIFWGRNP